MTIATCMLCQESHTGPTAACPEGPVFMERGTGPTLELPADRAREMPIAPKAEPPKSTADQFQALIAAELMKPQADLRFVAEATNVLMNLRARSGAAGIAEFGGTYVGGIGGINMIPPPAYPQEYPGRRLAETALDQRLAALDNASARVGPDPFDTLLRNLDAIDSLWDRTSGGGSDGDGATELNTIHERLRAGVRSRLEQIENPNPPAQPPSAATGAEQEQRA